MVTSIVDGRQVGVGTCIGLVEGGEGVVDVQSCWVGPRKGCDGTMMVTGHLFQEMRNAVLLVRNVVYELRSTLASHFNSDVKTFDVVKMYKTLHVHIESNYRVISSSYYMGAIFISLVSLLVGRRPRCDVVVFGEVNPVGLLRSCWEWTEQEVAVCVEKKVRHVVVGVGTKVSDEAQEMMDVISRADGKPLVEIHHVKFISHTLQYLF